MKNKWISQFGFLRSWVVYEANLLKKSRKKIFYKKLIQPKQLVFDIGGHLGDRTSTFASLGARVVCVEPQKIFKSYLTRKFAKNQKVNLEFDAIGAKPGQATFKVNNKYPTLSTLSSETWIDKLSNSTPQKITYDESYEVTVKTMDQLIEKYGLPDFSKIDVEGFEFDVLSGLSRPVPTLSFEFISFSFDELTRCLELLVSKGYNRFNWSFRERFTFVLETNTDSIETLVESIKNYRTGTYSGDVYAWHESFENN